MKGISKEAPWPGARCGWIEVYNADKDPMFKQYVASILNSKMVEVCSTTLPQKAIPALLSHPEYPKYLEERKSRYERCSNIAYDILKKVPGLKVNRTNGAFYMAVAFEEGRLTDKQTLPIAIQEVQELVEGLVDQPGLLAGQALCLLPAGFHRDLHRAALLVLHPRAGLPHHPAGTGREGIHQDLQDHRRQHHGVPEVIDNRFINARSRARSRRRGAE